MPSTCEPLASVTTPHTPKATPHDFGLGGKARALAKVRPRQTTHRNPEVGNQQGQHSETLS